MEKFNLEKAKKGKPICTRNGKKAIYIGDNSIMDKTGYPIEIIIEDELETQDYTKDGYYIGEETPCKMDLMMA